MTCGWPFFAVHLKPEFLMPEGFHYPSAGGLLVAGKHFTEATLLCHPDPALREKGLQ